WVGFDGAAHAQLQGVSGTSPFEQEREVVLRWGARVGLSVGGTSAPWSPFASAHATFLGDRRELVVLPRGVVGELPGGWLGRALGVAVELCGRDEEGSWNGVGCGVAVETGTSEWCRRARAHSGVRGVHVRGVLRPGPARLGHPLA